MVQQKESELLRVEDLQVSFFTDSGEVKAVRGVSFGLNKKETLGIVGESGCGKSATVSAIMRLLPTPPAKIKEGSVSFEGTDLLKLPEREILKVRGNRISMIFQEPMTALNPVMTIGDQIMESMLIHENISKAEAKERMLKLLKLVEIPSAEKRAQDYPHQLSGGMRQRVMIAMALSCNPDLLIADEPTTALDVTIQAQILELLKKMRSELHMSVLLITHDMGIVAENCDRVAVMYAGQIVEIADVVTIFKNPSHPYTRGLLKAIPKMNEKVDRLYNINGLVPRFNELPPGCAFSGRCPYCREACKTEKQELVDIGDGHFVRCRYYDQCGKEDV